ncbi:unnamed protein product [Arctia plantaginis]|uniref:Peptidase S1 domain-containing protein n=1 Tax=Arctia plantaginis TaxID=874455 RepID=A0A8S1AXG4_ARCPL|nr:unnamed protein product [Arctia plantaginis]
MEPFVVKGDYANINSFPHSAHLGVNCKSDDAEITGKWACGASIVTQEAGLTAAHCLYGCTKYSKVTISAGNVKPLEGVVTLAQNFVVHSDYTNLEIDGGYDIALVRFRKPLKFSSNIKRVALIEKLPMPKEAYVAGWGIMHENPDVLTEYLKEAKQFLMTRKECGKVLGDIPVGTICARNEMGYASRGDSGSALIVKGFIQIGLVSYKVPTVRTDLVVYTDVSMQPFIVDGDNAKITSHPHALHLGIQCKSNERKTLGKWICGASILTHEVGLTVAHCLNGCSNYTEVTISAGNIIRLKGVVTSASNFTLHPDFVEADQNQGNDIALVRFKKPLKFSSEIKRVALMEKLKMPKEGHVAGWGVIQETPTAVKADRLKELKQNLLTREKCKELLFILPKGTICGRNEKFYPAA